MECALVTKISMAAPAGTARPRSSGKDTTPAVRAWWPEQRRRQRTSTFAPLVAETLRLLTMMPVPVGVAVSFGVATSSGGQPPCARTPGSSGQLSSGSNTLSSSRSAKNWKLSPRIAPDGAHAGVEAADLDGVMPAALDARDDEVLRAGLGRAAHVVEDLGGPVVELVDADGDVEAAGLDLECAVDVGVQVVPDRLAEGAALAGRVLGAAARVGARHEEVGLDGRLGRVDARLDLFARQARVGAVDRRGLQVVVVARNDGERDGRDDQRAERHEHGDHDA